MRRSVDPSVAVRICARAGWGLPVTLLAGLAMACGGSGDGGPAAPGTGGAQVSAVSVTPATATLDALGDIQEFRATARDAGGQALAGVAFTWSLSDTSVGEVDGDGAVTARANGTARVEARSVGAVGFARLTVRAGGLAWRDLAAGLINSCGLTTHRTTYCWGDDVHGQLDLGGPITTGEPTSVHDTLTFDAVTVGGSQLCALSADGTAYCWGNGSFGERGDGVLTGHQPVATEVLGGHRFLQVSAGGNHTCGVTVDAAAYCWGHNGLGALGDGTTTDRAEPARVADGRAFVQVSAGVLPRRNHTCGTTESGEAYCWGPNDYGQLGDGTTTDRVRPAGVAGGLTFARVDAGGRHTCGLTPEGRAHCWGRNASLELGDGSREDSTVPVEVGGGLTFLELTVGGYHACGLATDGTAHCWGNNGHGQLGDGTTGSRELPTPVVGGHRWTRLSATSSHTCGLATDGVLYCWGRNVSAQLGQSEGGDRLSPTAVAPPWEGSGG